VPRDFSVLRAAKLCGIHLLDVSQARTEGQAEDNLQLFPCLQDTQKTTGTALLLFCVLILLAGEPWKGSSHKDDARLVEVTDRRNRCENRLDFGQGTGCNFDGRGAVKVMKRASGQ